MFIMGLVCAAHVIIHNLTEQTLSKNLNFSIYLQKLSLTLIHIDHPALLSERTALTHMCSSSSSFLCGESTRANENHTIIDYHRQERPVNVGTKFSTVNCNDWIS
jgi:hypothetical protein